MIHSCQLESELLSRKPHSSYIAHPEFQNYGRKIAAAHGWLFARIVVYIDTESNSGPVNLKVWHRVQSTNQATMQSNPDWPLGWFTTTAVKILSVGMALKQNGTNQGSEGSLRRTFRLILRYTVPVRLAIALELGNPVVMCTYEK